MTYSPTYGRTVRVTAHQLGARPVGAPRAASAKQVETVAKMRGRKLISSGAADALCRWDDGEHTAATASTILDELFAAGWAPRPSEVKAAANPVTEVGMYADGAKVYRVQAARGSGNLYAKLLTIVPVTEWTYGEESDGEGAEVPVLDEQGQPTYRASFEYAGGAIRSLTADMRMTDEAARAIGHEYGVCCVCAAVLSDPKSVKAGIGPVCASRV